MKPVNGGKRAKPSCSAPPLTSVSKDPEVQAEFYNYFPQYNLTGDVETDIYNYLMMANIPDNLKEPEMSAEEYSDFMV